MKAFTFLLLVIFATCTDYPLYQQCDAKWAKEKYASSTSTICQAGDLLSSVAMAMTGSGHNQNPSTLNTWLKANKGYTTKSQFVWTSINSFGMTYEGQVPNSLIRLNLDVGYVVIIAVNKGPHYVLATGYKQNTIFVNDPQYPATKQYDFSQILTGHTHIYKVPVTFSPEAFSQIEEILRISNKKNNILTYKLIENLQQQ